MPRAKGPKRIARGLNKGLQVLLAAARLCDQSSSPVSASALVVAAWSTNKQGFGLKGFEEQYPDSNRVLVAVMGSKGLVGRKLLKQVGEKSYTITQFGRTVVRNATDPKGDPLAPKVPTPLVESALTVKDGKFWGQIITSEAFLKFNNGDKAGITFTDACDFWGLDTRDSGDGILTALAGVKQSFTELAAAVGDEGVELASGGTITAGDVRAWSHLDDYLRDRFERHLKLLTNRKG